ncbi:MAG: hypothetical protein LUQ64_02130 [Methanomicrobiales archaeon]|nr:hypothetical protein [Methanomicrobiales archaeon]
MGIHSCYLQPALQGLAILVVVFALSCGCMAPAGWLHPDPVSGPDKAPGEVPAANGTVVPAGTPLVPVTLPEPATPAGEEIPKEPATPRTFSFLSGSGSYTITVPVRDPRPPGTAGVDDDCPMARWRPGNEGEVSAYYQDRIFSGGEEELYTALTRELSRIRRMEGLNDDEYLELVTNFIQQIPYDPKAPLCPRSPSSVIRDGKGDCDEKSGLLLGLLSREGYDVALLLFPDEHHATAGIRITSPTTPSFRVFGPRSRTYVYVETTRPSLIGLYGDDFATATPVVVPVGNGTIRYRAINDVMYVIGVQKRMEDRMTFLWESREETLQEISLLEGRLTRGYYDSAEEDSDAYARYSRLIADYNRMGEDFTDIQDVYQFLRNHQYDRAGCRGRIENSKVELLL